MKAVRFSIRLRGLDDVIKMYDRIEGKAKNTKRIADDIGHAFADFTKVRLRPHTKSGRLASGFGYVTTEGPDVAPSSEAIMEYEETSSGFVETVGVQNEYCIYFEEGFSPFTHKQAFGAKPMVAPAGTTSKSAKGDLFFTTVHHPGASGRHVVRDASADFEEQFVELMRNWLTSEVLAA